MSYANYVKFIRGTQSAYDALLPEKKDSNTLYFIYDSNTPQNIKLYLGGQLISSTNNINSLQNLSDINLQPIIENNSILIYDNFQQEWTNISFQDLINLLKASNFLNVMEGAENSNLEQNISGHDGSEGLVPMPLDGEANFFLQGTGQWADINPIIEKKATQIIEVIIKDLTDGADQAFDTLKEISDWIIHDEAGVSSLVNKIQIL